MEADRLLIKGATYMIRARTKVVGQISISAKEGLELALLLMTAHKAGRATVLELGPEGLSVPLEKPTEAPAAPSKPHWTSLKKNRGKVKAMVRARAASRAASFKASKKKGKRARA